MLGLKMLLVHNEELLLLEIRHLAIESATQAHPASL